MCLTLKSKSWSSVLGRSLISLRTMVDWCLREAFSFLEVSYLNLPKSMILQTGGAARGLTSTSSSPCSSAILRASCVGMMPTCPPSAAMTRTSGTRMRRPTR